MANLPELLTPKEVADWLGITEASLAQNRYIGGDAKIPFFKVGQRVRYVKTDVLAYLDANRKAHA